YLRGGRLRISSRSELALFRWPTMSLTASKP
ncbi:unnamed protein product, partial [Rotaria magnacalcarata]